MVICSHSREEKILSYRRINAVMNDSFHRSHRIGTVLSELSRYIWTSCLYCRYEDLGVSCLDPTLVKKGSPLSVDM